MTLEDASCPAALLDESIEDELKACFEQTTEDDENATLTFRDMVKAATPIKKHNTAHESEAHIPSCTTRTPLANLILAQATSTPILESNDKLQEEPSIKFITEGSAPERVCFSALEPQEAVKPVLTVRPPDAPEDIPLPSSPAISTPEFFPTVDMVTEQVDSVNAEEPLNCANISRTIHSTPHGSNNNAWKNDNGIEIAGTEESVPKPMPTWNLTRLNLLTLLPWTYLSPRIPLLHLHPFLHPLSLNSNQKPPRRFPLCLWLHYGLGLQRQPMIVFLLTSTHHSVCTCIPGRCLIY